MGERQKQLQAQFDRFPPHMQEAIRRAFVQFASDLKNKESRTAKSLAALCAFAKDTKKGRRALEIAFIEDPVVRKTVLELIRRGRKKKRERDNKASLPVDDPRRLALRVHRRR